MPLFLVLGERIPALMSPKKPHIPVEEGPRLLRHLRELIAAIDRRVPDIESAGENAIAQDAVALREKAMNRIAELERTE
jgi:hypothetical protein